MPVRAEIWHHWIFVNLDGKAPPLADYLAPALERIGDYDLNASRYAGTVHFDIATNWKFAMENYIEPYHVFAAHPRLHAFVPMAEREPSKIDRHVMWNRYIFKQAEEGRGAGLPHFPDLSYEAAHKGLWFILPVPFGLEVYPDHVASFHVTPIAPDLCHERIDIYLIGEAADAPQYEGQRKAVLEMWRDLNKEDVGLIESLQKGRTSPAYDGGRLSPYWDEAPASPLAHDPGRHALEDLFAQLAIDSTGRDRDARPDRGFTQKALHAGVIGKGPDRDMGGVRSPDTDPSKDQVERAGVMTMRTTGPGFGQIGVGDIVPGIEELDDIHALPRFRPLHQLVIKSGALDMDGAVHGLAAGVVMPFRRSEIGFPGVQPFKARDFPERQIGRHRPEPQGAAQLQDHRIGVRIDPGLALVAHVTERFNRDVTVAFDVFEIDHAALPTTVNHPTGAALHR